MKRYGRKIIAGLLVAWFATALWQTHKPMPEGTHIDAAAALVPAQNIRFLHDLSFRDAQGKRVSEQQIFPAAFELIENAQRFIVLDFFLFNGGMGEPVPGQPALSRELADRLLARKRALPELRILLITDPINEVYGGRALPLLDELRAAGIDVVTTALSQLRDPNPLYSALWRGLVQWSGNSAEGGRLPNPFEDNAPVTLRSWLALLNFKANHRKVLIADRHDGQWRALVTSANPHDASSAHSNIAVLIEGPPAKTVLDAEFGVARFSAWLDYFDTGPLPAEPKQAAEMLEAAYVTEGAIHNRLLNAIDATASGDAVSIAVFYLSERRLIESLLAAARRGVDVRLILDPNKDAFGREKDGVPNRPVANELVEKSNRAIQVRWYRTSGEQFHTKLALIHQANRLHAILGSANFTRRNLADYNLEANFHLLMRDDLALAREFTAYFERLWKNEPEKGVEYTAPFEAYRDESKRNYWRYRFMEATGLSTF